MADQFNVRACQLVKMLSKSVSVDLSGGVRVPISDVSKSKVLNNRHVRGLSGLLIRISLFNSSTN